MLMRALSIRQPWAWLIANGFKDIENRTWNTNIRGPFLIHAGQSFDLAGYNWVRDTFPDIAMPGRKEFHLGGVFGQAEITGCIPPGSQHRGKCSSPWYMGEFGYLLEKARPLPFMPMKGQLRFFEIDYVQAAPGGAASTPISIDPAQACLVF